MSRRMDRGSDESGFTLIELLVVILIIGILAAIAIPSFLSQKSKAYDASAKELARTAQTTAETYATDHSGSYTGLTKAELEKYETALKPCPTGKVAPPSEACLAEVSGSETEYEVVTRAVNTGDQFSVKRGPKGEFTRKCESGKKLSIAGGKENTCAGGETSTW